MSSSTATRLVPLYDAVAHAVKARSCRASRGQCAARHLSLSCCCLHWRVYSAYLSLIIASPFLVFVSSRTNAKMSVIKAYLDTSAEAYSNGIQQFLERVLEEYFILISHKWDPSKEKDRLEIMFYEPVNNSDPRQTISVCSTRPWVLHELHRMLYYLGTAHRKIASVSISPHEQPTTITLTFWGPVAPESGTIHLGGKGEPAWWA